MSGHCFNTKEQQLPKNSESVGQVQVYSLQGTIDTLNKQRKIFMVQYVYFKKSVCDLTLTSQSPLEIVFIGPDLNKSFAKAFEKMLRQI